MPLRKQLQCHNYKELWASYNIVYHVFVNAMKTEDVKHNDIRADVVDVPYKDIIVFLENERKFIPQKEHRREVFYYIRASLYAELKRRMKAGERLIKFDVSFSKLKCEQDH